MGKVTYGGMAGPQDPIYGISRANLAERLTEEEGAQEPHGRRWPRCSNLNESTVA